MPNAQFTKPWHGMPREQIAWNPSILEDACIDCGTCVTGCGRLVYRFDFERKKPVAVDPLNCMVGCTTCANTCPAHAIEFPPIENVLALEGLALVRHAVEDDLKRRRDVLGAASSIPHPDRIVMLTVAAIERPTPEVLKSTLVPVTPGQYIELWQPESTHLSRSYSIANAPHGDGSSLRVRLVAEQLDDAAAGSERLAFEAGTVLDALVRDANALTGRDLYIAGPPAMLRGLTHALNAQGIDPHRLHMDSFGI